MMLLALSLAGLLLGFAAFAVFGLPWLVMGNRAFEEFRERKDQHLMVGVFATAALTIATLPLVNAALISAAPQLQVFAETILGVPERFWS